ncbi:hypothetical protein [Mesobacillus subterraneus]|uniref:Uncharacterized protein n=1 Tax=Mesobacillus subterraneus TaxID=285983 RepID=A0A3R9KWJ4_9BACI|nr:hypothetical protein [Mesobacillus subterraneus]RSD27723.1 hypothetical protein EJA10_08055 [Mesobacillus subterraneus]
MSIDCQIPAMEKDLLKWDFGQNQRRERLKCPKMGGLRTKSMAEAAKMSEDGWTSDKINGGSS